jgi:hypothetical protein
MICGKKLGRLTAVKSTRKILIVGIFVEDFGGMDL